MVGHLILETDVKTLVKAHRLQWPKKYNLRTKICSDNATNNAIL